MVVKGGKHRLVGFVELGPLHDDMLALEGRHWHPLHFCESSFLYKYLNPPFAYLLCLRVSPLLLITLRARLHGEFQPGLKLQPGF